MTSVFQPDQSRYELDCKLGEGLNCNVWRATRIDASGLNRQDVALKLPKDRTSVSVLRREFETLTRVKSVHCARVLAWETCGDQPAIVMEWIDGVTLYTFANHLGSKLRSQLDQQRRIAIRDEVIRQIHQGLCDLRSVELFHGDLQPKNIMIDREGCVRLIDFASGKTSDGCLQATPAFVSPEVWAGHELSFDADIFALAVIRDHFFDAFQNLPRRSSRPSKLKIAKVNHVAQVDTAALVSELLRPMSALTTETIKESDIERRAARIGSLKSSEKNRHLNRSKSHRSSLSNNWRAAAAVVIMIICSVAVRAEAPADDEVQGSARIKISSLNWMQITMNGRSAGFTPLAISNMKAGEHRLTWKSQKSSGEIYVHLNRGDTVRIGESKVHPGQLEVR